MLLVEGAGRIQGEVALVVLQAEEEGAVERQAQRIHGRQVLVAGLGLDRHPELLPLYFGNYEKLVYLAQVPDPQLERKAKAAALRLGLAYEHRPTGYGGLHDFLRRAG